MDSFPISVLCIGLRLRGDGYAREGGGEAVKIGTATDKLEARAELSKFNGRRQQNACIRRWKQIAAASLGEIAPLDTWFLTVLLTLALSGILQRRNGHSLTVVGRQV